MLFASKTFRGAALSLLYNLMKADCSMNANNAFDNGLCLSYFQKTFVRGGRFKMMLWIIMACAALIFCWVNTSAELYQATDNKILQMIRIGIFGDALLRKRPISYWKFYRESVISHVIAVIARFMLSSLNKWIIRIRYNHLALNPLPHCLE